MTLGTDGVVDRPVDVTVDSADDPIPVLRVFVSGETHPRYVLLSDGDSLRGTGSAAPTLNAGIATLTDNTAGTANDTLQALADGSTYANDVAAIRNNFADLAAKVNAIIAVI